MSSETFYGVENKSYEFETPYSSETELNPVRLCKSISGNAKEQCRTGKVKNSPSLKDYVIVSNEAADEEREEAELQREFKLQRALELGATGATDNAVDGNDITNRKLRLSLSAEKISLKSQRAKKQINKSIDKDGDKAKPKRKKESTSITTTRLLQTSPSVPTIAATVVAQHQAVPINFKILPIGLPPRHRRYIDGSERAFPGVPMPPSSTIQKQKHAKPATVTFCATSESTPTPAPEAPLQTDATLSYFVSSIGITKKSNCDAITTNVEAEVHQQCAVGRNGVDRDEVGGDDESSEEINSSQFGVGCGSSTSPESLMDNILSAASSLSVRSSNNSSQGVEDIIKILSPLAPFKALDEAVRPIEGGCACVPKAAAEGSVDQPTNDRGSENRALYTKSSESKTTPTSSPVITVPHSICRRHRRAPMPSQPPVVVVHAPPVTKTILAPQTSTLSAATTAMETRLNRSRASPDRCASTKRSSNTVTTSLCPDNLKCSICSAVYHDPRVLNCLHSFCFQCLVEDHFKSDCTMSFWSLPVATDELATAALKYRRTNNSAISAKCADEGGHPQSPSVSQRSGSADSGPSSSSRSPSRRPSFGFIRKKSLEKILMKSEGKTDTNNKCPSMSADPTLAVKNSGPLIWCKVCNYATEVPAGGLYKLPQNFLLVRKIEKFKQHAAEMAFVHASACGLCFEETAASYHCLTCALNLCMLCKDSHERQRNTATHKIRTLAELRRMRQHHAAPTAEREEPTKLTLKCTLHSGCELHIFCRTCLQLICADCLLMLHRGHKHEPIAKAVDNYSRLLSESASQVRPLCAYAQKTKAQLSDIISDFNRQCDTVQAEVETFVQQYFDALVAHRKTLLQQVQRARESKRDMILEQQNEISRRINEVNEALLFTDELTELAPDVELLAFAGILLKRLNYCQRLRAHDEPPSCGSLRLLTAVRAPPPLKRLHGIPLYGVVSMQTVEPALCTLDCEGASELHLNAKVELALQARDAYGVALNHGGLPIKANLKYKEVPHAKPLSVEVCDNNDGTYSIAFVADTPGQLLLHIAINENAIKDSPFAFTVRCSHSHLGVYHCCAYCSAKGNRQKMQCACPCRMGNTNGCGHGHPGYPGGRHWSCCGNLIKNAECSEALKTQILTL